MASQRIVIFGGTGFLGAQVSDELRESGHDVVAATRHSNGAGAWIEADITDPDSVRSAAQGADAAINCVGLYRERSGLRFADIHIDGARNVAQAACEEGVRKVIHISGIGADENSSSSYIAARGAGEKAVRNAFPDAVILRPSAMIGPRDDLLSTIVNIPGWLPAIPLFGDGSVRLQPVHSRDVARGIRYIVENDRVETAYELGGPDVMSYADLLRTVMKLRHDRRMLMPFPMAAWSLLAHTAGAAGLAPITEGMVALMRHDNIANSALPGLTELGVTEPVSLEDTARQRFARTSSV